MLLDRQSFRQFSSSNIPMLPWPLPANLPVWLRALLIPHQSCHQALRLLFGTNDEQLRGLARVVVEARAAFLSRLMVFLAYQLM